MSIAVAYFYWINVITFALMAYDCHNSYFGKWRLPFAVVIVLSCIGGFLGALFAWLLFGYKPPLKKRESNHRVDAGCDRDNSRVPGWADPITGVPELPGSESNFPHPHRPEDEVDDHDGHSRVVGNEIIVLLNTDEPDRDMALFARRFKDIFPGESYQVVYYNTSTRIMQMLVPANQREEIKTRLEKEILELDFYLTDNTVLNYGYTPSSTSFGIPEVRSYYELIQAFKGWDVTKGSRDVTVAVVDSYFDLEHPGLSGRWRDPINIMTKSRNVFPPGKGEGHETHGSHVAGIAIGGELGTGVCGIAPECSWIPVSLGEPTMLNILEGVMYAIYKGADVVNLSLGILTTEKVKNLSLEKQFEISHIFGLQLQTVWDYVFRLAADRKCVIVWSAGNENALISMEPLKRNSETIKVSAVDCNGRKAEFSNFGNFKEEKACFSTLSAPGIDILSCLPGGNYGFQSGTSMSAPFVAGAVALMKSLDRSLSTAEIIEILQKTGIHTHPDDHIGPVIQICDALKEVRCGLVNYEDLLRNREKIIGCWEATKRLIMTDANDAFLDEVMLKMTFFSTRRGEITLKSVNAGDEYVAVLSLLVEANGIKIEQKDDACCRNRDVPPVRPYRYECMADSNNLLLCVVKDKKSNKELFSFNLRKVK